MGWNRRARTAQRRLLRHGVYRTDDGGKNWRHLGLSGTSQISKILIDPRDPETVLLAALGDPFSDNADRGVFRTTDGGKTWTKTLFLGPSTGASDLDWDPRNPRVVYAGMWQFRRTAWSIQSGGPNDGLYKSIDGGRTWKQLTEHGLPQGEVGRIAVAVAPNWPQRIYALLQSPQGLLWRSDNAGATWEMISTNTLINERPFYFSHLTVDPANADHVFASSVHLAVSTDGGKSFTKTGSRLHGDHHAMWIAADGQRILEGNDGGPGISNDGGQTWARLNTAPIGQAYHLGYDFQTSYHICAGLQDNGTWCGPSNSNDPGGILAHHWTKIAGGDGTFVWPDPLDSNKVWYSSGGGDNGGELWLYDRRTREDVSISPYLRNQNVYDPFRLQYRFNWEAPLAFSPFDPHIAYYGANVVFETRNRGLHWRATSPDLTRNIKAHQMITGGITKEGTGAETSDTILCIAPSERNRAIIWVGTDDGLIQLTRDGGRHWSNVSVPGTDASSRVETVEPSRAAESVAFANIDRHFAGDRRPYIYETDNYGQSWRLISADLPADQFVRTIRQDPKNPDILYAGLEQSLWISFNAGGRWQRLQAGLPPAAVRDIRIHPKSNDLIVGTHGRSLYILDDLTPLQKLPRAQAARATLFPIRSAIVPSHHSETVNLLAPGENPPGAPITFFQSTISRSAPLLEILTSSGRIVRSYSGYHLKDGKPVSVVPNNLGLNRIAWDFRENAPLSWKSAPEWNRGYDAGAVIPPGRYTVRLQLDSSTYSQQVSVLPLPGPAATPADYVQRYQLAHRLYSEFSLLDERLNRLDEIDSAIAKRMSEFQGLGFQQAAQALQRQSSQLSFQFSSHMQNDQDNDFLTDVPRERLQSLISTIEGAYRRPTTAQLSEARAVLAVTHNVTATYETFMKETVAAFNRQLIGAGAKPLDLKTATEQLTSTGDL